MMSCRLLVTHARMSAVATGKMPVLLYIHRLAIVNGAGAHCVNYQSKIGHGSESSEIGLHFDCDQFRCGVSILRCGFEKAPASEDAHSANM